MLRFAKPRIAHLLFEMFLLTGSLFLASQIFYTSPLQEAPKEGAKGWSVVKTALRAGGFCPFLHTKSNCLIFLLSFTGCPIAWAHFEGKCYFFSAQEKSWHNSRNDCTQSNADLAIVNSNEELVRRAVCFKSKVFCEKITWSLVPTCFY